MDKPGFAMTNRWLGLTMPDQLARLEAMQDDMDALYEASLPPAKPIVIRLSPRDSVAVANVLITPRTPNQALMAAAKRLYGKV